jgi:hypothetical protein
LLVSNAKYFLGSFAINFGKPNSSDTYLNDYMIEKYNNHEDNNNDTFVTHAYLNNIIGCNQPDSFLNFVNHSTDSTCTNDIANIQIINNINYFKKTDATRFNYQNSILAVLASYGKYANQSCLNKNKSELINCILGGKTSNIIKPFLKNITLNRDALENQKVKIFDATDCNGYDLPYTIYHIYGSISIPDFRE